MKKMGLLKNNKGFTLIEMIIVLIIIAILAAIGIPAMIKYVDEARQRQNLAACRTVYVASQTVVTKAIAEDMIPPATVFGGAAPTAPNFDATKLGSNAALLTAAPTHNSVTYNLETEIIDFADGTVDNTQFIVVGDKTNGKVLAVYYERKGDNGNAVTIYADGGVVYNTGVTSGT